MMVLQIVYILSLFTASSLITSAAEFGVAKAGCVDHCGNISIPYPFGTTEECYQDYSFWVTCNETKLFARNSSLEIRSMSLEGQVRYMQSISQDCYDRDGNRRNNSSSIQLPTYFTVNNTANMFTIVSCDALAYFTGHRPGRRYWASCSAWCDSKDDLVEGSCRGTGCCQSPIPGNVSSVEFQLNTYSNYSEVWDFNNCGYAFLVEEAAFSFSLENFTNLENGKTLPIVVDWAIGNGTCEEATTNSSSYACVSPNSGCYKPDNGYGYRCRCLEGYRGNPYLNDSCLDIDECADATLNNCTINKHCTNTKGNYTCSCPKGYSGDGRGLHGCIKKHSTTILYVSIGIAFAITGFLFVAILLYMERKRRSAIRMKLKLFDQNGGNLLQEMLSKRERSPDTIRIFTSSELKKATNNFHSNMIVGQGGFGVVYKGELADNTTVAIKKFKRVDSDQIEQFINEVVVVSQINHRNVVRLLGCCLETEPPLLVYEFVSNGTLSAHIHDKSKTRFLNWETRLRIAAESAGVLSYLHYAAATTIIHRDVKSDNILLDHTLTAKVADFGASKLVPQDLSQFSTMVQGTRGYLDPEYVLTNQLTEKSNVYSFGVVLLELLTGRKAISFDKPENEKNLAFYFLSIMKQQRLFDVLDESIVCDENMEQMSEVARVAKECLNVCGEDRPSMKQVALELEGMIEGGKHSWERNAYNAEEIECLNVNVVEVEGDNSPSVGYDSIRDHVLLPISGGR